MMVVLLPFLYGGLIAHALNTGSILNSCPCVNAKGRSICNSTLIVCNSARDTQMNSKVVNDHVIHLADAGREGALVGTDRIVPRVVTTHGNYQDGINE